MCVCVRSTCLCVSVCACVFKGGCLYVCVCVCFEGVRVCDLGVFVCVMPSTCVQDVFLGLMCVRLCVCRLCKITDDK